MKYLIFILILSFATGCAAALPRNDNFREWKEEVQLNDGRVIAINQKWRCDYIVKEANGKEVCGTMSAAWLTFQLPGFDSQEITWHESLAPIVLNIEKGQLYVVGTPHSGWQSVKYGEPRPPYVGFRLDKEGWRQISFDQIPKTIYSINLTVEMPQLEDRTFLNIKRKALLNGHATRFKKKNRLQINPD